MTPPDPSAIDHAAAIPGAVVPESDAAAGDIGASPVARPVLVWTARLERAWPLSLVAILLVLLLF